MNALGRAALGYAHHYWCVFPCKPGGKTPMTPHGCKDATMGPRQVMDWWSRWPNANIGVATGAGSELFVVDLDGAQGLATWAQLEATHDAAPTLEQTTGGGVHLLFTYPDDGVTLGNSAGRLGPGVDTRGEGGYILAAPSLHPSGRRYAWVDATREPAPCPPWLVDLLTARPDPPPRPARPGPEPGGDGRLLARFEGLLDLLAAATEGTRNSRLYWAACRLRELQQQGAPGGWAELLVAGGTAAGLPEPEARRTVRSALQGEAR
jgi:Bifunctional DNA primase/polymerase, N-terminal